MFDTDEPILKSSLKIIPPLRLPNTKSTSSKNKSQSNEKLSQNNIKWQLLSTKAGGEKRYKKKKIFFGKIIIEEPSPAYNIFMRVNTEMEKRAFGTGLTRERSEIFFWKENGYKRLWDAIASYSPAYPRVPSN